MLNIIIFFAGLLFSGWAIYRTACFLVAGVGSLDSLNQQQFNATLLNYLWLFLIAAAITGSLFHFYLTKKLIAPIRKLTQATKELQAGKFTESIEVNRKDEVGQLAVQYNQLITQLQDNENYRKKLVSDISHEIRTPLTNINGYLLALKDDTIEGDTSLFAALYEESSRLTQMVEQLDKLKEWDYFSQQIVVEKEEHALDEIILQSLAMFQMRLDIRKTPVVVNVEPCSTVIHAEGIKQVMSNLLDNAIRYNLSNETIEITGHRQVDNYFISIAGTSSVLTNDDQKNIFERFYRIDESRNRATGGAGLGLAISKEIIDKHGGEIGVLSNENKNKFWFTLPLMKTG